MTNLMHSINLLKNQKTAFDALEKNSKGEIKKDQLKKIHVASETIVIKNDETKEYETFVIKSGKGLALLLHRCQQIKDLKGKALVEAGFTKEGKSEYFRVLGEWLKRCPIKQKPRKIATCGFDNIVEYQEIEWELDTHETARSTSQISFAYGYLIFDGLEVQRHHVTKKERWEIENGCKENVFESLECNENESEFEIYLTFEPLKARRMKGGEEK